MQKIAYVRLISSLIICFSVILYNVKDIFVPIKAIKTAEKEVLTFSESNSSKTQEKTEKEEIKENSEKTETTENKKNTISKTEKTESMEVSVKDVKGKIIEKYISPYSAPSSYDKVYIKNSTGVNISIKSLLEAKLPFKIEKNEEPQVLIMHTHGTESFMEKAGNYYTSSDSSRSRDNSKNMIKLGEKVTSILNEAGIKTLHDKTHQDYPEYTGSYSRAKDTISWYLKKYPSIKVVIDLHRDSISSGSDKTKLVTEINGKKAAQVMLVMGSETGPVSGHPNWKENLKLAFKIQQKLETKYPTLARPLMLASKLYNQNLTKGSVLIEIGTDANTMEEAYYSAELVGKAIAEVL